MAHLVGQTLGNYRIEAQLGAGGMGEVYRAVHVRLDRPAAIKVLHANQAADPTFQARFLREARAAAALSHPNIVEVFDFGEQDGASYLVMELVPDGSLRTLLRQRSMGQGWSLGLGVDLMRQAAEGLAYAHAHGMVHRDIKPDNLLLHRLESLDLLERGPSGERYQLKISDFGLARLVEDGGELTVTGMVMGTPTYMSPEQCQGGALDGRSDLYSLGVVLYEVATGSPPFRVKTLSEAVFKHISAPPVPPREIRPDLPIALEEVILRCLEKRPEDRFATGIELAEALDGALGETELRTIITTRDTGAPATPTPAALATPTAPTVADSVPAQRPPAPSAPTIVATPQADDTGDDGATIRASVAVATTSSRPARVRPARPAGEAGAAPLDRRPPIRGAFMNVKALNGPSASGFASALLAQPKALGIGGAVALFLIALLIVGLSLGSHTSANPTGTGGKPTATVNATPTASPTPVETVKFQDSLNPPSSKWQISSHSFPSHGGYEVAGAWTTYAFLEGLGNQTISVRMSQLSGPSDQFYGILFRATNDSLPTGYFFGITENQQWTFAQMSQGDSSSIVAPTTDVHIKAGLNASNTITVRAIGSHFIFYINGTEVGRADKSAFSSGRIGLITTAGGLDVVYNDFKITIPAS